MGEDVKQFMSDSDEDPSSSEEDQEDHSSEESDSEDDLAYLARLFLS